MIGHVVFGAYALFIAFVWAGLFLSLRDGETSPTSARHFAAGAVLHVILVVLALSVFR